MAASGCGKEGLMQTAVLVAVCVLLLVYLAFSLLRPEKF
jgi:K+-transporting ATPase KdpF subunit